MSETNSFEKRIEDLERRVKTLEAAALSSISSTGLDIPPEYLFPGGAIPMNVFEFLQLMDKHLVRIPEEERGRVIINMTTKKARQNLEDHFYPHNFYPKEDKVRTLLINMFGQVNIIIKI